MSNLYDANGNPIESEPVLLYLQNDSQGKPYFTKDRQRISLETAQNGILNWSASSSRRRWRI